MPIRVTFPDKIYITSGASMKTTVHCLQRNINRPSYIQSLAAAHVAKHGRHPDPKMLQTEEGLLVSRLDNDLVVTDEYTKSGRTFTIMTARDFSEFKKQREHLYKANKPQSTLISEEQGNADPEHHTGGAPPEQPDSGHGVLGDDQQGR